MTWANLVAARLNAPSIDSCPAVIDGVVEQQRDRRRQLQPGQIDDERAVERRIRTRPHFPAGVGENFHRRIDVVGGGGGFDRNVGLKGEVVQRLPFAQTWSLMRVASVASKYSMPSTLRIGRMPSSFSAA
jgi:hypothetical protein